MKKYNQHWMRKLVIVVVIAVIVPTFLSFLSLPDYCQIMKGDKQYLNLKFPFKLLVTAQDSENLRINGQEITNSGLNIDGFSSVAIQAFSPGKFKLNFHLFGIIPIRKMVVKVVPEIKVMPGGQGIGVMLEAKGVMVVKNSYVVGATEKKKHFPAQKVGIEVGDSLLSVNGKKIKNKYQLARLIDKLGRKKDKLNFKVKKQSGKIVNKTISPVKSRQGHYMIGIYVDDGAAGVGTMSFYHPDSKHYGALGHMITELNTNLKIDVEQGEVVEANISGVKQSQTGNPGEKLGSFFSSRGKLGNIKQNNRFGIYGQLSSLPQNPYFENPIPVASPSEVETDSASLYTVIEGEKIEEFEVKIEQVKRQYRPQQKGLIVKIIDKELLRKTGGIVQGMSGSPIVQDNKLVGVVTHVFVNDATRGFGVLAQWMVIKSGLLDAREKDTRELVS